MRCSINENRVFGRTVPANLDDIAPCIAKGSQSSAFPNVYTFFSQSNHFLYKIDGFRDIISLFSAADIFSSSVVHQ